MASKSWYPITAKAPLSRVPQLRYGTRGTLAAGWADPTRSRGHAHYRLFGIEFAMMTLASRSNYLSRYQRVNKNGGTRAARQRFGMQS